MAAPRPWSRLLSCTLVAHFAVLLVVLLALPGAARAQDPRPESIPPELEPWVSWVRDQEQPPGNCRDYEGVTICSWSTNASLRVDEDGGSFTLEVAVSETDTVELIGDDDTWPQDVRVDGKPALVLEGGGYPELELGAGNHRVEGRFVWSELPEVLRVPQSVAMVELIVEGVKITFPSRDETLLDIPAPALEEDFDDYGDGDGDDYGDEDGDEDAGEAEPTEPEPDTERLEVSRLLSDGVPLQITTRVDLRISGQDRELKLPYPVWEDAKLVRIDSDLPVALAEDDSIELKLSSGTHYVTFTAELPRAPEQLGRPQLAAPWPASEVWVWNPREGAGQASMGNVVISGGAAVDRTRTHAPPSWPEGATYTVTSNTPLSFEVLQRGVAESAPNELQLQRSATFDLAGEGWHFVDAIAGTMNSSTRLDLSQGALGAVVIDGKPQVITVNSEGQPGVELRNPQVLATAQWRQQGDPRTLPLSGWSERFEQVSVEFKLPRGWDLLHVSGPGRTSTTWLGRWDPLHVILILAACFALGYWVDKWSAAAALVGLSLMFSGTDEGFVPLLVLLVVLAGLPVAMRRPLQPLAARGLRLVWLLGVFVLLSWVCWFLPEDLEKVWRYGMTPLGNLEFERSADQLMGLAMGAAALAGVVALTSWLVVRVGSFGGGLGSKLVVAMVVGMGMLALTMLTMSLGSRSMEPQLAATAMEAPPPEEEFDIEEETKADEQMDEMEPPSKQRSGLYAMKGPQDAIPQAYGGAFAVGNDDADVWGGLTGSEVGEAYGVGGLGLVGTGRGGGGTGEGTIGLGNTGLIGKGGGGGTGSGYGRGSGAGFGGRGKRIPMVRQAKATVQGKLDKDIVRRVVRAHINEVRSCYNTGLQDNPDLQGRVAINFVITNAGKVGSSVVQETTLEDKRVANCIAKAVKRWKFPKPQGEGQVIVTYPFNLSSDGGGGSGAESDEQAPEPTRYLSAEEMPEAPPPEIPQTGEAKPEWNGRVWTVEVERSVEPGEQLELRLLSPRANQAIALLRDLALASVAMLLFVAGWGPLLSAPSYADLLDDELDDDPKPDAGAGKAGAVVAALLLSLGAPSLAQAAPPDSLLEELADRVNEEPDLSPSPECGDACALVPKLELRAEGDTLSFAAEVHMEGPGVFVIPGPLGAWAPSSISVDNKPASAVVAYDDRLLVRMEEGLHRVVASGAVADDELNIRLYVQPKRIDVEAEGWKVTGLDERHTATNLQLLRERDASEPEESLDDPDQGEGEEDPLESSADEPLSDQPSDDSKGKRELPVWLSVTREIEIGPRWTMRTSVRRVNAGDTPIKIKIPLLEGEQMIESSQKIEDPKATLTLEHGGDTVSWTSVLDTRDTLTLHAPAMSGQGEGKEGGEWTESWVFVCGAAWQCNAEGLPASEQSGARSVYHPWPGESLEVALFKPTPAEGARLSIDEALLTLSIGEEGTSAVLTASVRTSTVGERTITLPASAHIEAVSVDDKDIPTNKDSAEIRLTFQPGTHQVRIEWKQDEGWSSSYTTPAVSLGGEAVNARVSVVFSDERTPVLLRTSGEGWGPAVWLWAWALAMLALALLLHRSLGQRLGLSDQLKLHDWLLLALGFPVVALPMVLGWFLAVGQRKRLVAAAPDERRYNMVQLGIGLLTLLFALLSVFIAYAMLTETIGTMPENFYGDAILSWYLDRTPDAMPQGRVLSVPASAWRVLGIAWVGWFVWRSIAWVKWAHAELAEGGWLRWPPPAFDLDDEDPAPMEQLEAPKTEAGSAEAEPVARVTQLDAQDGERQTEPQEPDA